MKTCDCPASMADLPNATMEIQRPHLSCRPFAATAMPPAIVTCVHCWRVLKGINFGFALTRYDLCPEMLDPDTGARYCPLVYTLR